MKNLIKEQAKKILSRFGYELVQSIDSKKDFDENFKKIYAICKSKTCTSQERMLALYEAVNYIEKMKIEGDFVECGVWKGGSSMIMALSLLDRNISNRTIYLYDTFAGMSKPTDKDINIADSKDAFTIWKSSIKEDRNDWAFSPLDEVKKNMLSTKYPEDKIIFVKGKVEDTIPSKIPKKIALLRLDTDWFESTYHELKHLFPRLVKGGILIIDDYGHWAGAKEAVDQYFKENNVKMFLHNIDGPGRIGVKLS